MKTQLIGWVVALVIVLLVLFVFVIDAQPEESSREWWNAEAKPIVAEFYDILAVAENANKTALPTLVLSMRDCRRAWVALDVPDAAEEPHALTLKWMNAVIDAVEVYMRGADQRTVNEAFDAANDLEGAVVDALLKMDEYIFDSEANDA
jgi:hypothetical protein